MAGNLPPVRGISQTFFNDVGSSTRNSDGTLTLSGNTDYAFYTDSDWLLDKAVNQTLAPRARFTQNAYDILKNGTYSGANLWVSYNGKNYKFTLTQDSANGDKNLLEAQSV